MPSPAQGCDVVVADIDEAAAATAAQEAEGARTAGRLAVGVDVTEPEAMRAARRRRRSGSAARSRCCASTPACCCGATAHESTIDDWRWILDVNVMGVVNGIRAFLPLMLDQGTPAHIVTTASVAGLRGGSPLAAYSASKSAVVSLSESLSAQLAGTPIGVTVLCPANIESRILDAQRTRPSTRGVEGRRNQWAPQRPGSASMPTMSPRARSTPSARASSTPSPTRATASVVTRAMAEQRFTQDPPGDRPRCRRAMSRGERKANRAVVAERFYTLMNARRFDEMWALFGPNALWSGGSGPGRTLQEMRQIIIDPNPGFVDGGIEFVVHATTAEQDRVAVEVESHTATLTNGRVYNNHYHMLFVLDDGTIRT